MKKSFFYVPIVILIFIIYPVEVYSVSPTFSKVILHDKTDEVETNTENQTILREIANIRSSLNIQDSVISGNGTHLEIRFFSDDIPTKLTSLMVSDGIVPEPFANILVNSDDDESSGFYGYDYAYSITSEGIQNIVEKSSSDLNSTAKYLYDFGLLTKEQFENKKGLEEYDLATGLKLLNWTLNGYDIIDYAHIPLIYTSIADDKYISFIQDGIKIVLPLDQVDFPEEYSLLIQAGVRSEKFKITNTFGRLDIPVPDLYIGNKIIQASSGSNSELLVFNSTANNNLNVTVETNNKSKSKGINIGFPDGNKFTVLEGTGSLPIKLNIDPEVELRKHLFPMNVTFSMIRPINDADSNNTGVLGQVHNYSDTLYLNLDVQKRAPLGFKFPEIPIQYMAVILTGIVSVFIPTLLRMIYEHNKKRIASNHLKRINKNYDESNIGESIEKLETDIEDLKHDFIRGRITKDQYELLDEKMHHLLKKLIDKYNNNKSA